MKTMKSTKIYIGLNPEEYEILEKAGEVLDRLDDKYQEICESNKDSEIYLTRDTYQIIGELRDSADGLRDNLEVDDYILNDDIYDPSEHTNP